MKFNQVFRPVLVILIALLVTCCSDQEIERNDVLRINAKNDEEYILDLGLQKTFDRPNGVTDAIIIVQANHFRKSEIEFEVTGLGLYDKVLFKYLAVENYEGKDYVEIRVCKSSECRNIDSEIEIIKVEFSITK